MANGNGDNEQGTAAELVRIKAGRGSPLRSKGGRRAVRQSDSQETEDRERKTEDRQEGTEVKGIERISNTEQGTIEHRSERQKTEGEIEYGQGSTNWLQAHKPNDGNGLRKSVGSQRKGLQASQQTGQNKSQRGSRGDVFGVRRLVAALDFQP